MSELAACRKGLPTSQTPFALAPLKKSQTFPNFGSCRTIFVALQMPGDYLDLIYKHEDMTVVLCQLVACDVETSCTHLFRFVQSLKLSEGEPSKDQT